MENQLTKFDETLTFCLECEKTQVFRRELSPETGEPVHPSVGECTSCGRKKSIDEFYTAYPVAKIISGLSKSDWPDLEIKKQSYFTSSLELIQGAKSVSKKLGNNVFYPGREIDWTSNLKDLVDRVLGAYRVSGVIKMSDLLVEYHENFGRHDEDFDIKLMEIVNCLKSALPSYSVTKYEVEKNGDFKFTHNGFAVFYVKPWYFLDNEARFSIPDLIKIENAVAVFSQGYDVAIICYIGIANTYEDFQNRCAIYRKFLFIHPELVVTPLSKETEVFCITYDPGAIYKPAKKIMPWEDFLVRYMPEYR